MTDGRICHDLLILPYRKTDPLFISFVIAQLYIVHSRALEILFQVWLLYYYTTLALRENVSIYKNLRIL